MCRAKSHCSGGRRCDEGKSYLRTARRRNARKLAEAKSATTPVREVSEEELEEAIRNLDNGIIPRQEDVVDKDGAAKEANVDSTEIDTSNDDLPESIMKNYKDYPEARLDALRTAQESEELKDITFEEMASLEREPDEEKARLASIKRRLRIYEIRERTQEIKDRLSFADVEMEEFYPLIKTSGALIAAEGSYSSGLYIDEQKKEIESLIESNHELRKEAALISRKENMEYSKQFHMHLKAGSLDGSAFGTKTITYDTLVDILEERYPDHDLSKKWVPARHRMREIREEFEENERKCAEKSSQINAACIDVIRNGRSFGLKEGQSFRYHPLSHADGVKKISSVVDSFPQDWWDRASTSNLHIRDLKQRAHYMKAGRHVLSNSKMKFIDVSNIQSALISDSIKDFSEKPPADKLVDKKFQTVTTQFKPGTLEHATFLEAAITAKGHVEGGDRYRDKPVWLPVRAEIQTHVLEEGEKATSVKKPGFKKTPAVEVDGKKVVHFYRIDNGEKIEYRSNAAEVTTKKGASERAAKGTALHEMSHHFESNIPSIGKIERAFFNDRTKGESLSRYAGSGANAEVVRNDNFIDVYMGRDYATNGHGRPKPNIDPDESFEILSTGSESLNGEFGGLIGFSGDYKKADHDMRNFIFGLFSNV